MLTSAESIAHLKIPDSAATSGGQVVQYYRVGSADGLLLVGKEFITGELRLIYVYGDVLVIPVDGEINFVPGAISEFIDHAHKV